MAKPAYMILARSIKGLLMNDLLMKGLITKDLHIKVGFPNRFVFSSKGPHPGFFFYKVQKMVRISLKSLDF